MIRLFYNTDPEGYEIELDIKRWEKHILKYHPEMAKLFEEARRTIANPDIIYKVPAYPEGVRYRKLFGKYRDREEHVEVAAQREKKKKTGWVASAWVSSTSTPPDADIFWTKDETS